MDIRNEEYEAANKRAAKSRRKTPRGWMVSWVHGIGWRLRWVSAVASPLLIHKPRFQFVQI